MSLEMAPEMSLEMYIEGTSLAYCMLTQKVFLRNSLILNKHHVILHVYETLDIKAIGYINYYKDIYLIVIKSLWACYMNI